MLLNRRELLAAFLGAPLAMSVGCSNPRLPPEGEIVGASHQLGHRLRGDHRPVPADDRWETADVVIVGGGIAGLSAAWQLQRLGIRDFVVLELEPEVGGTSRSGRSSLCPFPWGAHYLPVPQGENPRLIELLQEMQVLDPPDENGDPVAREQFLCRDPEERLFAQGRWREGLFPSELATDDDHAQLSRFRKEIAQWAAWHGADGRKAFPLPSAEASADDSVGQLDRLTMQEWLDQRRFTSHRLRWTVDYACRDDYGLRSHQTSAWAGVFYFASRLKSPFVETQPLMTWPEGNGRFVLHFLDRLERRPRTGVLVTEIRPAAVPGASVEVIGLAQRSAGPEEIVQIRAKKAIFAGPQFLAGRVIRGLFEERPEIRAFEYGSWMVANLHLSGRPQGLGFPLCWDNVIEDSPSLGYIAATHQIDLDHGPTVLTYYYPLCDDDPAAARNRLLQLEWRDWADVCLTDLERAHPDLRGLVQRLDVMRWGHAMVRPKPGFRSGSARISAAQPFRHVHFAQTDLSGLALFEEAFHHGCRAADEVAAALTGKTT